MVTTQESFEYEKVYYRRHRFEFVTYMLKIKDVTVRVNSLPYQQVFEIARGKAYEAGVVLLAIDFGDVVGIGATAKNSVTGDSIESIVRALSAWKDRYVGMEYESLSGLRHALGNCPSIAARAALDFAVHDAVAKAENIPLYKYLGGDKERILTSITIGIMENRAALAMAARYIDMGFRVLKIKVGKDVERDITLIREIRDLVGDDIAIRVDANCGYSVSDAIKLCKRCEGLGVEFVEQPVLGKERMAKVAKNTNIPIMADEDMKSVDDVIALASAKIPLVNIKLIKCGGIFPSLEIARACDEHGINAMVGCFGECSVSLAFGLHFALGVRCVRYADLDSAFLLSRDIGGDCIIFRDGYLYPKNAPGIGIEYDDMHF